MTSFPRIMVFKRNLPHVKLQVSIIIVEWNHIKLDTFSIFKIYLFTWWIKNWFWSWFNFLMKWKRFHVMNQKQSIINISRTDQSFSQFIQRQLIHFKSNILCEYRSHSKHTKVTISVPRTHSGESLGHIVNFEFSARWWELSCSRPLQFPCWHRNSTEECWWRPENRETRGRI